MSATVLIGGYGAQAGGAKKKGTRTWKFFVPFAIFAPFVVNVG